MREEQKILNHFIDTEDENGHTNILHELQTVTEQKVEELDYEQQIDRWNRYQQLLDKIEKKCDTNTGVRLARNVWHNFKLFTATSSAVLAVVGITGLMALLGAYTLDNAYYAAGGLFALGVAAWQAFIRLHHPSAIHFKCSPVLHIDEFAYIRHAIKSIPPIENDPVVRLPVLEMSVSRAWLAQHGMLKLMQNLVDI
ncbi:MAG: hypothetical protein HRF40_03595 [Nitrososphaera sp.]|jgi:hypothetical protein